MDIVVTDKLVTYACVLLVVTMEKNVVFLIALSYLYLLLV